MILTPFQINELLSIINVNQSILIGKQFGVDFLSENDIDLLDTHGVFLDELYSEDLDSIYTSFHLGMLAQSLDDNRSLEKLDYRTLRQYIKDGEYIPLTKTERDTITAIKSQTMSDIRSMNGRIFQDLNNFIVNNSRETQEEFLREELAEGVKRSKTVRQIANDISHKVGDWKRDFDRIVEYQMNTAYQEGRASFLQSYSGEKDPLVYKQVFNSACKHCIKAYLTGGIGSPPKLFKLSEIKANGTNIGRKVADWRPIIGSHHPYCRCLLHKYPIGYEWDEDKQIFGTRKEKKEILKQPRKKIRVKIGGREAYV